MIEAKNISHSFNKKEIISDISFSLSKGELVALLGINGVGKSTLMNILCGILTPDTGTILVNEQDINKTNPSIKRKIGYLSENNPLYNDMYLKEFLTYIAQIYLDKQEAKRRVDILVEEVGLQKEYKKLIGTLSKGNRQRVGIAQALVHDPSILIFDEPSNGFDPAQQEELKLLLNKLKQDKSILISTHHILEVANIATRFLIMNDRKIVYDNVPESITVIEDIFYKLTR